MFLKLYQWVSKLDDLSGIILEDVEFYVNLYIQRIKLSIGVNSRLVPKLYSFSEINALVDAFSFKHFHVFLDWFWSSNDRGIDSESQSLGR